MHGSPARLSRCGTFLALAVASLARISAAEEGTRPRLVVRVYDDTSASRGAMASAGDELTRILLAAGVEARWIDCSGVALRGPSEPGCHERLGPLEVILRISRCPEKRSRLTTEKAGFAVVPDGGGPGVFAGVFRDRLPGRLTEISRFRILGLLAAHEVGHLLLRSNLHSGAGIMRPSLSEKSLESASQSELAFSRDDSERVRVEFRHRLNPAASTVLREGSRER